jgi:hypothetical protein
MRLSGNFLSLDSTVTQDVENIAKDKKTRILHIQDYNGGSHGR